MRKTYLFALLCFALFSQGAWADDVVFNETFNDNSVKGGRDGDFKNGSGTPYADYTWTNFSNDKKVWGANHCIRFGSGDTDASFSTPSITLTGTRYALLTFCAAGWDDSKKNTLAISISTGEISGDTNITELENGDWEDYSVLITLPEDVYTFTLTFTGRRGFLDDVKVRNINSVDAPDLPDEYTFWPKTTEAQGTQSIHLNHTRHTTVYYTTDGSIPSNSNGTAVTAEADINISGTTTVKAIAYIGTIVSDVTSRIYTQGNTVNGISAFKAQSEDTEARLCISSIDNARITFVNGQKAFLRDKTGDAICVDFGTTAIYNPTPSFEQHIAGWIVGKYQTVSGLPTLVATSNTNTNYLAMAAKRNEADVEPIEIDASNYDNHLADLISFSELTIGSISTVNSFGLTSAMPYDGAIVDMTGIAVGNSKLAPTETVVFVIDEGKDFVSPASDLTNASIRLKRILSCNNWNTFTVPFDITNITGKIREYDEMEGTTMKFKDALSIEAGKPYLVKPITNIENPSYTNITLRATEPQSVGTTDYKFIATYSPKALAPNTTERFLTTSGKLGYSTDGSAKIKGMRAYFKVPSPEARLDILIDDETTAITEIKDDTIFTKGCLYNLNGQRVSANHKGIVIENGKMFINK